MDGDGSGEWGGGNGRGEGERGGIVHPVSLLRMLQGGVAHIPMPLLTGPGNIIPKNRKTGGNLPCTLQQQGLDGVTYSPALYNRIFLGSSSSEDCSFLLGAPGKVSNTFPSDVFSYPCAIVSDHRRRFATAKERSK